MVAKKKVTRAKFTQSDADEASATQAREPVITQVVEVIEIETSLPSDASTPSDNEDKNPHSSELDSREEVEKQKGQFEEQSGKEDQELSIEEERKSKQVVEELFNKDNLPDVSEISIHSSASSKALFLWAAVVIVVALATGLGLVMITKKSLPNLPSFVGQTPTVTPQPTPTPTPAILVKRGELKVQVLNGGGVPGAASKMKKFLEDKGYVVEDIGNTEEYTFEKTEITLKFSAKGIEQTLREDLSSTYTVAESTGTLPDDSDYDVQVTIGKE